MSAAVAPGAEMRSQEGTVIQRSDASSLPPVLQPAWKASPAKGRGRLMAIGGDMFSPIKLQQMFHTPSPESLEKGVEQMHEAPTPAPARGDAGAALPRESAFTFRAEHPARYAESTPYASVRSRVNALPSTPGGPHVPLRLFNLRMDERVRSGLEQLVEERDADLSVDESLSMQNPHEHKRARLGSATPAQHDTPSAMRRDSATPRAPPKRIPLSYRSSNVPEEPSAPRSSTLVTPRASEPKRLPSDPPRSILKKPSLASALRNDGSSRSISFADQAHPTRRPPRSAQRTPRAMTPRTARLENVLEELEQMNITRSTSAAAERSLADASFGVARNKMLELLTDAAPWEPDWRRLRRIDLRARRLESCIGLAEFLPNVEEVWLDQNEVAFATGLPPSVRVLCASSNKFTELASFEHLRALEVLDVSGNELASLAPFAALRSLRELRADHNRIASLAGVERLERLRTLSVAHNALQGTLDLGRTHWGALEQLHLAHNALTHVHALGALSTSLHTLDVESNALRTLGAERVMHALAVVRVSGNTALCELGVDLYPALRTLYADACALREVHGLARATQLRSLSLRQQRRPLACPLPALRSVQRLFLSGNALTDAQLLGAAHPALLYLELAGCQLTAVPASLAQDAPNLRTLNLDHNHIDTLPPLRAFPRLKRLSAVGCRLARLEGIAQAVHEAPALSVLDTRTNPCTLGLYPPLLIPVDTDAQLDAAALPPVPNAAVVQPDSAHLARRASEAETRAARALADRSQFHKRTALVPPEPSGGASGAHAAAMGARATDMYIAADERFAATLPRALATQRRVYRGLCGMACGTLTWLDGLELRAEDVAEAEWRVRQWEDGAALK